MLVSWISCNVPFNTSLRAHSGGIYLFMNVSGDVCDEVVSRSLMSKSAAFLSKPTSVKMYKHLRGVNAFVFFLACQSDRDDVANGGVSSESQCVSCSSVGNELSSAGVEFQNVQTFNPVSKNVFEVFEIECRGQRASADISCVLPCFVRLWRSSLCWLPMECHMAFWTCIVILIQSKRTPTHSGRRRLSSGKCR